MAEIKRIKGSFIVVRSLHHGDFQFVKHPHVHRFRGAAEQEALRLAARHPGTRFFVFEMVAKTDKEPLPAPIVAHGWGVTDVEQVARLERQRLALAETVKTLRTAALRHDQRVEELLLANNAEVERRRAAEAKLTIAEEWAW